MSATFHGLEIEALAETNRRLNRRANGADSYWQKRAMKAEQELAWSRDHWSQEFDRMGRAFDELREIYLLVEKARGHETPKFHSVNDCCHPDSRNNAGVFANVFLSPRGGVRHERVLDAVRDILHEKAIT